MEKEPGTAALLAARRDAVYLKRILETFFGIAQLFLPGDG